jgi:hypothetical protein
MLNWLKNKKFLKVLLIELMLLMLNFNLQLNTNKDYKNNMMIV